MLRKRSSAQAQFAPQPVKVFRGKHSLTRARGWLNSLFRSNARRARRLCIAGVRRPLRSPGRAMS